MTFQIITLGCKVNTYESEIMRESLLKKGYQFVEENADITIINTCSVTNMADKKSRKMVGHAKRENPNTILVVAGCSSENKNEIYEKMEIDILIGNKDKSKIVSFIEEYLKTGKRYVKFYQTRNLPFEDMSVEKFSTHTRAFLKIQDGCNNFCSYCIIPFVRGTIRSKEMGVALDEVKTLVQNGHQEVVLTGIHTGSYGEGTNYDLTDLIHEMSKIDALKRIRISSIEITELNDKFLNELKNNPKICNHLHIPLQAGSDEILLKMRRKYDLDYFEKKLKEIRYIRPDISISTDVIVGHPFETEELFLKTLENCKKFQFSKIHAFPYSLREGTLASTMKEQVLEVDKKNRNKRLIELSEELERNYSDHFLNQTLEVLIEDSKESVSIGHTSNYLEVHVSKKIDRNSMVCVKFIKFENNYLVGEVLLKEKVKS